MLRTVILSCVLAATAITWPGRATQAGESSTRWLTGKSFQAALQAPSDFVWANLPLREALDALARTHHVAIFLDRRVDPGLRVTYSSHNGALLPSLSDALGQHRLGVGTVGALVYVGPARSAAMIGTAAELANDQVRNLPAPRRRGLLGRQTTSWPRLTVPRTVLEGLAVEAGFTITNSGAMPHDLWVARELPPLTWAERMTVILTGFDLAFRLVQDEPRIQLVTMPRILAITREYRSPGDLNALARDLSQQFPQAYLTVHDGRLSVRSTVEDHKAIAKKLTSTESDAVTVLPPSDPGQRRYTLTVQDQPLRPLLQTLADRVDRKLVLDPSVASHLQKRVSFTVSEVELEKLFEAALAPVGLTAEFEPGTIRVHE